MNLFNRGISYKSDLGGGDLKMYGEKEGWEREIVCRGEEMWNEYKDRVR